MQKIIDFRDYLLAQYPKDWMEIDGFIKEMIPHEGGIFDTYKSKYYKKFVPKTIGSKAIWVLSNEADEQAKKYSPLFGKNFIDFKELFNDFDEFYFDIESWSNSRRTGILEKTNELLFECNTFKGVYFFKVLVQTILEIKDGLKNLENMGFLYSDKPNWLQVKLKESLELEIEEIKNILISNYELVYPKLNSLFIKSNPSLFPSSTYIWYKIAKLMAIGYLEIDNQHFIVNGKEVFIEAEAARQVSTHLYGNEHKYESISPYLNQTKQDTSDDKNIFITKRIYDLKNIAKEASKENNLSEYFKTQIRKLESKQYK